MILLCNLQEHLLTPKEPFWGELEVSFLFLNISPLVPCKSLARVICVTNKWMYIFPILMAMQMWFILWYIENRSYTSMYILKENKWARKKAKRQHMSWVLPICLKHTESKKHTLSPFVPVLEMLHTFLMMSEYYGLGEYFFLKKLIFKSCNVYPYGSESIML